MTEAEALAKMRALEDRIRAPSIWGRVACGLRFEDLQDRRYEEAVSFLKKHYLNEEITCRSLKITEDKEGMDEFIHNARIWLKDKMSIAVVKDGTDKLVGLLIMRIQEKHGFSRTFSRVKITYNPNYSTIMKFYNDIEKPVNLFEKLDVRRYLKIYVLALKNRYRHRGVAKELLKAAVELSKSAFIPAVAGIMQTSRLQQIAEECGYKKYNELYYVKYYVDKNMVFCETGIGNYGAALMGYRIPEVEEPFVEEIKQQASTRFSISADGQILGVEEEEEEEKEKKEEDD